MSATQWDLVPDAKEWKIKRLREENERLRGAAGYVIDCYADGDDAELYDAVEALRALAAAKDEKP